MATNSITIKGPIEIPSTVINEGVVYSVTSIRENAFKNSTTLTSVTIPDSVTSIGLSAFGYSALTSVTIGKNVTSIGNNAFFTSSIKEVIALGMIPPNINNRVVFRSHDNIDLIIPKDVKLDYENAGWTSFKSYTEAITLGIRDTTFNNDDVALLISDNQLKVTTTTTKLKYYTIYSITGAKVLEGNPNPNTNTVSIAHLPHGVYIALLTLDKGKGVISKKFAK